MHDEEKFFASEADLERWLTQIALNAQIAIGHLDVIDGLREFRSDPGGEEELGREARRLAHLLFKIQQASDELPAIEYYLIGERP